MELDSLLEERKVTITLPSEVWEILDGSNELAIAAGSQGFEDWVTSMILHSVMECLKLTTAMRNDNYGQSLGQGHGREGNA